MNAPLQVRQPSAGIPALMMDEAELISVLQNSIYPGAKLESIKMVVSYCRAGGLDPLQKPVHIVPMRVKKPNGGRDDYEWRDVVMPGIGLYRTQAARSGLYAGVSEPEFGPDKTMRIGDTEFVYPEWCRVTVKRLSADGIREFEFTATEYWIENYATKGRDSRSPNDMWGRRPRGQIAKCAEAQALRKAFPEIGAAPTADEMEGKVIGDEGATIDGATGEVIQKQAAPMPARRSAATQAAAQSEAPAAAGKQQRDEPQDSGTAPRLIDSSRINFLRKKSDAFGLVEKDLCAAHGVAKFDELTEEQFEAVKAEVVKL